ncbi:MAG TPA: gliding motility protein GldN [Chitinophagaceae bacterium]|nr:gliding motility protein GldN [Chitinophagaceae bacterium]HMZ46494.1 gliding motility protein GldN [Chitinophagaceae bacterium]HNF29059.1 gliding motility protein GldN [Chitinophagaceae bacterium]HNL82085.1 gliding motility protein GldN [Chitinophagaceae bacterium]HNM33439.1 gliding motility protein GldN [Chitinophagaceae bacterium]
MKKLFLGIVVISSVIGFKNDAFAQFKKAKKTEEKTDAGKTGTTGTTGTGGVTSTTSTSTSTAKKDTTIIKPGKRFDTTRDVSGKEYGGVVPTSKRNAYGYTKEPVSDRKPLPYDHIREDDATFSHFVWREIDAREKMNLPFIYSAKDETGDQRFFSIILNAIKNDSVVAFDAMDDRFTTPLSINQVISMSSAQSTLLDTTYAENPNDENVMDTVIKWKENLKAPKPDSIYKFRIKEQWMFDREASKFLVRIIGIAPLAPNPLPPGVKKSNAPPTYYPLFWVYYPDLRPTLSRTFAYNPKNIGGQLSWEEVFEGRFFSSYIIKSTVNNPGDKTLAQLIEDPLFRLLEGENIKEKLFNYEQDLWSY